MGRPNLSRETDSSGAIYSLCDHRYSVLVLFCALLFVVHWR